MNTRNSAGVISAWEPGISASYAWANPVVRETQAVVALNLHTINQLNGEALKAMSTLGSARSPADWPALQWSAANAVVTLLAGYGSELGSIVSRLNGALQEVGQTQSKMNDIQVRSFVDAFQSRTQAAASAVTSAVATALSNAPAPEALARQQTEDAIARASSAAVTRPHKAVVD
ncbi:Phasin protein [Paraburkholderia sp. Tr-20389]|uniref:phasin family protein n=1 Tax=Paraburkholderia sp. Tr-20389 TaxID=2703903 RepID=UPI00197D9681|nr:phasin family protein [Paraburkholderia sp. Tr-20389]MBN3753101.1 Phasin protein [Paraburkholderia sp. Tr-20389]